MDTSTPSLTGKRVALLKTGRLSFLNATVWSEETEVCSVDAIVLDGTGVDTLFVEIEEKRLQGKRFIIRRDQYDILLRD